MSKMEFKGNSYEEAVASAVEYFGISQEELDIERVSEGKRIMNRCIKKWVIMAGPVGQEQSLEGESDTSIENNEIDEVVLETADKPLAEYSEWKIEYNTEGVFLNVIYGKSPLDTAAIADICRKKGLGDLLSIIRAGVVQKNPSIFLADAQEEKILKEEMEIELFDNDMRAVVSFHKPEPTCELLTTEEIQKNISDKGISYGIDTKLLEILLQKRSYDTPFQIAKGFPPIDGKDGWLTFMFDISKKRVPKIDENGNVDFLSLSLLENVTAEQVLVEMTPSTSGVDGKTVRGVPVKAKPGKRVTLPVGKNVKVVNDGLSLVSKLDGKVEYVANKVNVHDIYEVHGDVDLSVGNIDFIGSVVIKGNVMSRFTVKAIGSVEVFGVVEAANIIAEGDIILRNGIDGMGRGTLRSGKSITAKFIQQANVSAEGDVRSQMILHSNVTTPSKVVVGGKKGAIVGGRTTASSEVQAKVIGSPVHTPTIVETGISVELRDKKKKLEDDLADLYQDLEKIEMLLAGLKRLEITKKISPQQLKVRDKAKISHEEISEKLTAKNQELEDIIVLVEDASRGKIHVRNEAHPGTKLIIGSATLNLENVATHTTFRKTDHYISLLPFEGKND